MSEEIKQRKEVLQRRIFLIKDPALLNLLTEHLEEQATLTTEVWSTIEQAGRLWEHLETTLGERENPIEFVTAAEETVANMRKIRSELEQYRSKLGKRIDCLDDLFNQSREKFRQKMRQTD